MSPDNLAVLNVVSRIAAAYPRTPFSEQTVAVWVDSLKDLPVPALEIAAKRILATATFCPSIAEIRMAALHASTDLAERSAEAAWGAVLGAIGKYGWARPPEFEDPLVERALQCTIGWYDLCTSDLSDGPSHRARFIAAYESLHRKAIEGHLLPDVLKKQIADCRKDFIAGTLGGNSQQDYISDQRAAALKMLRGFGDGGSAG